MRDAGAWAAPFPNGVLLRAHANRANPALLAGALEGCLSGMKIRYPHHLRRVCHVARAPRAQAPPSAPTRARQDAWSRALVDTPPQAFARAI